MRYTFAVLVLRARVCTFCTDLSSFSLPRCDSFVVTLPLRSSLYVCDFTRLHLVAAHVCTFDLRYALCYSYVGLPARTAHGSFTRTLRVCRALRLPVALVADRCTALPLLHGCPLPGLPFVGSPRAFMPCGFWFTAIHTQHTHAARPVYVCYRLDCGCATHCPTTTPRPHCRIALDCGFGFRCWIVYAILRVYVYV